MSAHNDMLEEEERVITDFMSKRFGITYFFRPFLRKVIHNGGPVISEEDFESIIRYTTQELALLNYFGVPFEKIKEATKFENQIPKIYLEKGSPLNEYGFGLRKSNIKQVFDLSSTADLISLAYKNPTLEERLMNSGDHNQFYVDRPKATIALNEFEARRLAFQDHITRRDYNTKPLWEEKEIRTRARGTSHVEQLVEIIEADYKIQEFENRKYASEKKRRQMSFFHYLVERNYKKAKSIKQFPENVNALSFIGHELAEVVREAIHDEEFDTKYNNIRKTEKFLDTVFRQDRLGHIDPIIRFTLNQYFNEQKIDQRVNIFSPEEADLRRTIYTVLFDIKDYSENTSVLLKDVKKYLKEPESEMSDEPSPMMISIAFSRLAEELGNKIGGTRRGGSAKRKYMDTLVDRLRQTTHKYHRRAIVNSTSPFPEIHDAMHGTFCMSNGNTTFDSSKYLGAGQFGLVHRLHPAINTLGLVAEYDVFKKKLITPHLAKAITMTCDDTRFDKKYLLIDGVVVPEDIMFLYNDWREYFFDNIFEHAKKEGAESVLINLQAGESHISTHLFQEFAIEKAISWSKQNEDGPKYYDSDFRITSRKIGIEGYLERLKRAGNILKIGLNDEKIIRNVLYSHILNSRDMPEEIIKKLNVGEKRLNKEKYNYLGQVYLDSFKGWYEAIMSNIDILDEKFVQNQLDSLGITKNSKNDIEKLIESNIGFEGSEYKDERKPHLNYGKGGVVAIEIPISWYEEQKFYDEISTEKEIELEDALGKFRNTILFGNLFEGIFREPINLDQLKGLNNLWHDINIELGSEENVKQSFEVYLDFLEKNKFFGDPNYIRYKDEIYDVLPEKRSFSSPQESYKEFLLSVIGINRPKLKILKKKIRHSDHTGDLTLDEYFITPRETDTTVTGFNRRNEMLRSFVDGALSEWRLTENTKLYLLNRLEEVYIGEGFLIPFQNLDEQIQQISQEYKDKDEILAKGLIETTDELREKCPGWKKSESQRFHMYSEDIPRNINYLLSFLPMVKKRIHPNTRSYKKFEKYHQKIIELSEKHAKEKGYIHLEKGYDTKLSDGFKILDENGSEVSLGRESPYTFCLPLARIDSPTGMKFTNVADMIVYTINKLISRKKYPKEEKISEAIYHIYHSINGIGDLKAPYYYNFLKRVEGFKEFYQQNMDQVSEN